ncbi:phosphoserine phosphatase, partial [Lecanoromycetidae sp. Uapishka_2]
MQYTIQHDTPKHEKLDYAKLRHHPLITQFETTKQVEIILDHYPCPESPNTSTQHFSRPLKLALFDMDSTLINEEVIDELARSIGISAAVSAITARAMNGDIDFETSLKERVAMLKGVPVTVWQELKTQVTIAEGARELISGLKKRGVLTVVVSGGFMPMAEWLKGELGLDVAVANHLVEEGPTEKFPYPHLSGQLDTKSKIVTPERKKDTLLSLAKAHSIDIHETMAVGDGSNDLLMLHAAGLGIAFRAKPKVQAAAPMRLNGQSLAELLWLFGPEPPSASDALA